MENDLQEIIAKHTVHYRVWPRYEMWEGKKGIIGFDLELYGTHDHGKTGMSPGCELCVSTFADLQRLAESILPKDRRLSQYDIPPFDQSLHRSPKGVYEVVLPIRIEHRHNHFDPVDSCEELCLKEMEDRLAELGVERRHG
jgi:hypothetical protein